MRSNKFLRTAGVLGAATVIGVAGMQIATASPNADSAASGYSEVSTDASDSAASRRGKRGPRGPRGFTGAPGQTGATGQTGAPGQTGAAGQNGTNGTNGTAPGSVSIGNDLTSGGLFALAPALIEALNGTATHAAAATTITGFTYTETAAVATAGDKIEVVVSSSSTGSTTVTTFMCTVPAAPAPPPVVAIGRTCTVPTFVIPAGGKVELRAVGAANNETGDFITYRAS